MAPPQPSSASKQPMNLKQELVDRVWQHARVTAEADPAIWRQDACGAWMRRDQYGHDHAEFGWRIENVSAGAPNDPANLRPFHCRNRFDVANNRPHCAVIADRAGAPAGEYVSPPLNRDI
jgi:hypothetical protein